MQARNSLFGRTTSVLGASMALALAGTSAAQVTYSFNWNANNTGWTGSFARNVNNPCAIASTRFNLWSSAPNGTLISPNTGTATGVPQTLSYNYKCYEFSGGGPTPAPWGSFDVEYGPSATGPWTTFATISNEPQSLGVCIPKTHVFTPPAGPLFIRWNATWTAGDFYLAFDDVSIIPTPACTTPAPGNTVGPASGCVGDSIVLTLQNNTPGAVVSYQWYESTVSGSGPWTPVGTNQDSYSATLTGNSWYYCDVTCSVGPVTTSSNVHAVTIPAPITFPQDWEVPDCGGWSLVNVVAGTPLGLPVLDPAGNSGFGVGGASILLDFWSIDATQEIAVVSPVLAPLPAGQFFVFDAAGSSWFTNVDTVFLEESNDGGTTWTTVTSWTNDVNTGDLATSLVDNVVDYGQATTVDPAEWTTLGGPVSAGTDRIRLRADSGFGNNLYVDNFRLTTSGPAYHAVRGVGCYDFSVYTSSIVEEFAVANDAKTKLDGNAMTFINTGSGYLALWTPGGATGYVTPSLTATLAAVSDEGTATITPTFGPSVIPGGTTTNWTIHANGVVTAGGTSNTAGPGLTLAQVGTSAGLAFYSSHDYDEDEVGSGKVKYEEVGNMLYITWDGVYGWLTTDPGTFQFQIDMSTGNVTIVWVSLPAVEVAANIAGATLAGTSVTPPSTDLTTALPFTMGADINQVAMGLSVVGKPINNGTPPNYTISNIPEFFPGSGIYGCAIVFGFTSFLPGGFDLGFPPLNIGAPGCFAYQSQDVTIILGNVGAPSITFPLTWALPSVPAGPAWMQAVGQFFPGSLPNGQNPGGYLTSNSLEIYINSF